MSDIKKKPEGSKWTDEQWSAIVEEGTDILVAAAAGSGKTAVLVERIIRKISDPAKPVDVDRLLVATFTKAAAAEMKQRIRNALEEVLENTTGAQAMHLRRQIALIPRAAITTLHSFCLEIVQRHAQLLQLDPAFRVAQETEIELIRQDVLEDLFEAHYAAAEDDSPFWELVEAFGGPRGDDELYQLVEKLYDFSRSHPWPEHWLEEQMERFTAVSIAQSGAPDQRNMDIWLNSLKQQAALQLSGAKMKLKQALDLCDEIGGPDVYAETLQDDAAQLSRLLPLVDDGDWDEIAAQFQSFTFSKLKAARGDQYDAELVERVKELRSDVKKTIDDLKSALFSRSTQQYAEELQLMAPLIEMLVLLVNDFAARFEQAKRAKGIVDFNDLEHYALKVLSAADAVPGQLVPSPYALEYREQFEEVLLDEYQDTNRVQESIVRLISREEPGNRFMVGDVKQSIYRFRLAEPELFMEKYRIYEGGAAASGKRIDLARNFRSRQQVIDGVNYVFRQIMQEPVGEMSYDQRAELVCGASFPHVPDETASIDLLLIDRSDSSAGQTEEMAGDEAALMANENDFDSDELETVQLEARMIARQIASFTGLDGSPPKLITDPKTGEQRPAAFRDIVILLRATKAWAPVIIEEFQSFGLPCYADVDSGYFSSGEVEMMLSLLKVIDNPYQDIPLAAVLRSPIVQLTADQLAAVRLADRYGSFFDAVWKYVELEAGGQPLLQNRLRTFLERLEHWRTKASQGGALSELIWDIYRETGLIEIVGGFPGGSQRQANLRALYDRARQYEATSFRGLFRFLRFIDRLRERGGDLGAARALSEQEDVVRIMSIHKSKGLEFPIVYVAGIGKMFNRMDLYRPFLLHKDLGFGPKVVDSEQRMTYPSLPYLAIQRRLEMEMLAEEMRVLYVAMTRAKEKLIFVGTSRKLQKQFSEWGEALSVTSWGLPDFMTAVAKTYLDWIGPALMRHRDGEPLRTLVGADQPKGEVVLDPSRWNVQIVSAYEQIFAEAAVTKLPPDQSTLDAIRRTEPIAQYERTEVADHVQQKLTWQYPHDAAVGMFTKTSVSELKRIQSQREQEALYGEEWTDASLFEDRFTVKKQLLQRPRFMEKKQMTPAERGTAYHTVMQHLDVHTVYTKEIIEDELERLAATERITEEQREAIDPQTVLTFFESELGNQLRHSPKVYRELPFSYALPASEVYPGNDEAPDEMILIQGVIDCLFEQGDDLVLLDYKTDAVYGNLDEIRSRYELQIELYARAISDIWKRPVQKKYLFLFDGAHLIEM